MDLNHLYLLVRDVERSATFYRDFFGFDGPSEWQGETVVVRNGEGFSLALTPDQEPPAWPPGLHFGFLLDSVADASRVRERIERAVVPILESYAEPGFIVFKCHDPDGYVVEVEAGVPEHPPA
jgi:catechol 2,3-dioxygenase-like lactoylglutathione lyase family enzyme